MPSLNALIARGEVCRALRAKTLFYETEDHKRANEPGPEGPFWCAKTQSALGPDGETAEADRCRPGRSCCETA